MEAPVISIVICCKAKDIGMELRQNISETIGTSFELIVIDNAANKHSIFQAYNIGIDKSKGSLICFLHDDILFRSHDWGQKLAAYFSADATLGLVGVAGATFKTAMPSAWWDVPLHDRFFSLTQHYPSGEIRHLNSGFQHNGLHEAAVVDGVFMATRRGDGLRFDEELKGFHNYDIHLSIQASQKGLKVGVTNEIMVEHFSLGSLDRKWVLSTYTFFKKYKNALPLGKVERQKLQKQEISNGFTFCNKLFRNGFTILGFRFWTYLLLKYPLHKKHLLLILRRL